MRRLTGRRMSRQREVDLVLECIASQSNKTPTSTSPTSGLLLPQSLPPRALAVSANAPSGGASSGSRAHSILRLCAEVKRRIAPTMQARAVGSPAVTRPQRPPSLVSDLADGAGRIPCPKQQDQPQRRASLASIAVRIIPLGASLTFTWSMPPEPGHLAIAPPPLALLHLSTTGRAGRHRWCLRAGQRKLAVYHRFPHSPPPR
jgi:hypothetical protein